jgi:hypothetical protein
MAEIEAILFSALAVAVGLGFLLGIFGAAARLSAFRDGRTWESTERQALARGGRGGLRFGLIFGLLVGAVVGYYVGPEFLQFGLLVKCFLGAAAMIAVAVILGLDAKHRDKAWKEGKFEDACPPPPF